MLGLVHAVATGQLTTAQHSLRYGLSPRDEPKPLTGSGARVQRACASSMQTFSFFAAAALVAHATNIPIARAVACLPGLAGIVMIPVALT